MFDAIYGRQSIEKKDSISIESQINHCIPFAKGDYQLYKDAGYSGSSTDRPDFQRMLSDIKAGKVRTVICYRLDRISRSLNDFSKLIEFFEDNKVEFISATEQFDTTSPIGRAMVYIIMVFAQLERETIAGRIEDNYFARAKKGMFTGGNCPFGYKSERVIIDGKECSVLDIDPDQSAILQEIFTRYTETSDALYAIAMSLPGSWTSNKVARIIKNPVSVKNTIDLYEYFKSNGYQIANPVEDFTGDNGCLLVGKEKGKKNRIYRDIEDQTLVIGVHKPIISSSTYIAAQMKLNKNKQSKRSGTGALSWLTGLLKCTECGHAITTKVIKEYRYFYCRGRSNYGEKTCSVKKLFVTNSIEIEIQNELIKHCQDITMLTAPVKENPQEQAIRAQIVRIDEQIDNLLSQMSEGIVGGYISRKIETLDYKKKDLQSQIKVSGPPMNPELINKMRDLVLHEWTDLDIKLKHEVAEFFIKKIFVSEEEFRIEWAL